MRLGLHIEVLFANFGFLAKPQPKVKTCFLVVSCILNFVFSFLIGSRVWVYIVAFLVRFETFKHKKVGYSIEINWHSSQQCDSCENVSLNFTERWVVNMLCLVAFCCVGNVLHFDLCLDYVHWCPGNPWMYSDARRQRETIKASYFVTWFFRL